LIGRAASGFEISNFAPVTTTFVSAGGGKISGRTIHLRLNRFRPENSSAELYLSDGGRKLIGTVRRTDGEHPVAWWRRVGPRCSG
jgi:hypothetical protein